MERPFAVKQTILLLEAKAAELRPLMQAALPDWDIQEAPGPADAVPDIWVGEPDRIAPLLAQGLRPRWVQASWAGYKPLLAEGLPRGYRLSRAVGVFGQPMAEYMLTYLLAHEQGTAGYAAAQAQRRWEGRKPGSLFGRRALIVGAGEIGREVGAFLAPFGVELDAVVHTPRPLAGFGRVYGLDELPGAVAQADYVVSILPDTQATRGIFDRRVFEAMKPGALFFNVGRGPAVVDEDLADVLKAGHLGGAVLDVFHQEPLPASHPFWTAPRVTITPHIAGPLVPRLLCKLFLENLPRYQAGGALLGEVDFAREY